jgi:hypothetical protein
MHQVDPAGVGPRRRHTAATRERLWAQAEGRYDSTFSCTPMELAVTIDAMLDRLPGPDGSEVDEHLPVIAVSSRAERGC